LSKPVRIGILTTLWKRPEIESLVLAHYSRLRFRLASAELVLIAVGSEGAVSRDRAHLAGWEYLEAPNKPLGAKHNAGMEAFADRNVAGVMTIGSDDLINDAYFELLAAHAQMATDSYRMRGIHFYDIETGRLVYAPTFISGAGRYLSADLLASRGWRPWPDTRSRKLDGCLDKMERQGVAHWVHGNGQAAMVDLKSDTNMWDFDESIELALHGVQPVPSPLAWWNRNFPEAHTALTAQQHHVEKLLR
jgi:hypothetical protein